MLLIQVVKSKGAIKTKEIKHRIPTHFRYLILFLISFFLIFPFSTKSSTKAQNPNNISVISINEDGVLGNNDSGGVSVSSDGRFIAYSSLADNLIDSDTNHSHDLFIYDRLMDFTVRQAESVVRSQISSDGRILSFTKSGRLFTTHTIDLLTGETRNISKSFWGYEANGNTHMDSLSFDGRYGTLVTSADNLFPQDSNGENSDVLLYDRVSDQVIIISAVKSGTTGNSASQLSVISDNGRTIAYTTNASDLLGSEDSKGVIFYDRVLGGTSIISFPTPDEGEMEKLTDIDLSRSGNKFVFLQHSINSSGHQGTVLVMDLPSFEENFIYSFNIGNEQTTGLALSGNGKYLALISPSDSESEILSRYNLNTGGRIIIDKGDLGSTVDLSENGHVIAYSKEGDGISQVLVWDETQEKQAHYILAGRVADSTGYPLALVQLKDDRGNISRTDEEGFFWINGLDPGEITIKPEKEGFEFEPKHLRFNLRSDTQDLAFTYTHRKLLKEAEKDIGMPYSRDRGDSGPYHGFIAGYCTDLILDAFTWGVNFNIQFALEMDFKAKPWHFYRWRDARDAQDMWRFFSYTGQILDHESETQPGDIVFFDWSEDGEIDHVAIISKVTSRNRPDMMIDATGKINSNPSGLAAELPWEDFHDKTVRGFARWSGKYQSIIPELPPGEVLQGSLGGVGLSFRFLNESGIIISETENEIDGGRFDDWIWEQSISVTKPNIDGKNFLFVISNPEDIEQPLSFTAQFLQDGLVVGRIEYKEILAGWQIIRIPIFLNNDIKQGFTLELGNTNHRIEGYLNVGNN